jgi:hypothetical protein
MVPGPAVLEELDSTTVVHPDCEAHVDPAISCCVGGERLDTTIPSKAQDNPVRFRA